MWVGVRWGGVGWCVVWVGVRWGGVVCGMGWCEIGWCGVVCVVWVGVILDGVWYVLV